MNIDTGEIKQFSSEDELQAAMRTGEWQRIGRMPKASCKKCYGRGHVGKNDKGKYVLCACVRWKK